MLAPSIYWVNQVRPWKIAIAPRPRGGEDLNDEMRAWRAAGVDFVVSLLETAEAHELDLANEQAKCEANSIRFNRFSIPDRGIPVHRESFGSLIAGLARDVKLGNSVLIHCRAGIGRTGLVACCLLQSLGINADQAFKLLTEARGAPVPDTAEQREYAEAFGS
jgi:protein-tyrosine phosphatase